MKVSTFHLLNWTLTILIVGFSAACWLHYREAEKAQQFYYAQDAKYTELLSMAVKDSTSVKVADLSAAEQTRDSARIEYAMRRKASDTLFLWWFALLPAHLISSWFRDRINSRKVRENAA